MLKTGLYEQVISKDLGKELDNALDKHSDTKAIDRAEASKVLAKYIAEVIERGLDNLKDRGGNLQSQVDLVNKIVRTIQVNTKESVFEAMEVEQRAEQLLLGVKDLVHAPGARTELVRPSTSIAQSSLFTGAIHEPSLFSELKKEILSADRIDLLVSFIKWSGLRLIIEELRRFTGDGGQLRIITTSYMGATDVKAVEELHLLSNTEIKVSYDTKRTRLHAKSYAFYRDTGFSTAYVGSANLSNAAISSGLEWNIKVTAQDLPETLQKISATFESYWNSAEFEYYAEEQKDKLEQALRAERYFNGNEAAPYLFDIAPYPYQQEILDTLQAERTIRGRYRNLIVAATGTGKTVISAFDYKRFRKENPGNPNRLLFIAHREEILQQSLACFRGVLKEANFGDLFVGGFKPEQIDHLFISVQTLNSKDWFAKTTPDFYDYIVVDESHHTPARTYRKLLSYYQPKLLLGLTATPERMDEKSVTKYFGNHITAEIRLPEAIERRLLCPFQYFGVTDTVDLNDKDLKWARGGYDKRELSNLYTMNAAIANKRCRFIISSLLKYVTDMHEVKGLGFCVSIEHARFMSDFFNTHGIPAMFLIGESPDDKRHQAKQKLLNGDVRFIFVVDIYNEGVDIPEVNTILFLRPTESLTIFLQQLGRGLRLAEGKECLTVLDFIGQANKKYNFEDKFAALLTNHSQSVKKEIENGFAAVPKGCYIQLERKAKEYVLNNIRQSFTGRVGLEARIDTFTEDSGQSLTLANFLRYYHLNPRTLYIRGKCSFSRLCALAGVRRDFSEPLEEVLAKALRRISAIDSRRWIKFLLNRLDNLATLDFAALAPLEKAMLQMFYCTVWSDKVIDLESDEARKNIAALSKSPVLLAELKELLNYNYDQIDFIDAPVQVDFECPLDVHCTYTRDQIFVGLGFLKPATVREGVKWLPDKQVDVFLISLNKSEKEYSPTTMYNDYSINEWLFHWQSQSTTSVDSPTGQRYIRQKELGTKVMLFVREFKTDLGTSAAPYTFLGLADYLKHEGSRPMNITYKLHNPIPAKYLKKTNKLVVG